jgi:cytoskeletal protein RodZ
LEIPTESIIEGYEQQLGHQLSSAIVPAGESPVQPQQAQATSNHFWVKTMTFTVITVLMVLAAVAIVSQNLFSKRTDTPTTILQIPLQSPPASSETLPEETVTPPLVPLPPSTGPVNPTETTSPPLTVPSSPTTEVVPSPATETMTIYLKQKSWLEITDSTNKKLYNNIANANSDFAVTGVPPFKVKVGNIDGVSIGYRGEKNPITGYSRQQNTTRTYLVGDKVPTDAPE